MSGYTCWVSAPLAPRHEAGMHHAAFFCHLSLFASLLPHSHYPGILIPPRKTLPHALFSRDSGLRQLGTVALVNDSLFGED